MASRPRNENDDEDERLMDEGPSAEDLEQFGDDGDETVACPNCGARVYDDCDKCPKCGQWITPGCNTSTSPAARWRRRLAVLLAVVVLLIWLWYGI